MQRKALLLASFLLAVAGPAAAACKISKDLELPATSRYGSPLVTVTVNGKDLQVLADSGAFFSMLSPAAAAASDLTMGPLPVGMEVRGVGGTDHTVRVGRAKTFKIGGAEVKNVDFLVGAASIFSTGAQGLLGQNILRASDIEYDLANGMIRLWRPEGCAGANLAYWDPAKAGMLTLDPTNPAEPHLQGTVTVNGVKMRATFDTGASTTVLTRRAAARAGVTPESAGVVANGASGGIGRRLNETWTGSFATFEVGGETIKNTRIRFADFDFDDTDMLIGADFFLSHRVFVATSQRRLYFTYNGGPVFRLDKVEAPPSEGQLVNTAAAPPAGDEAPKDAAGFARRGSAFATRRDFAKAIEDFTRAIELEPNGAQHYYDRAIARLFSGNPTLALADFNEAVRLKPDHSLALANRARLYLGVKDEARARADFDAAVRIDPNLRLTQAHAYEGSGRYEAAIAYYDEWIGKNPKGADLHSALNGRCWARAVLNRDLDQAHADCDAALRLKPGLSSYLDSRGLVRLKMGRTKEAIADYDAAIRAQPRAAWSLYARGLAKQRAGDKTGGDADIAAAVAMDAKVKEQAKSYGLDS